MHPSSGPGHALPFYQWLSSQKHRKDDIGRLADTAVRDKTFPRKAKRLHLFLHYYDLEPQNRDSIKRAHAEWRRSTRGKAKA